MGQVGDLILVTRNFEGKSRFSTVAPASRLLRPAGDSLGIFLYRYRDDIIIIKRRNKCILLRRFTSSARSSFWSR